jgi:hypothetical protein
MRSDLSYIKVLLTIIAAAAVYAAANSTRPGQLVSSAQATTSAATQLPQGGVPDSGLQFQQMVDRLGESNGHLAAIDLKLDGLGELLKSGKLEVVTSAASGQTVQNPPARSDEAGKVDVRKPDDKR